MPAFNEERLLGSSLSAIREAGKEFEKRGWAVELIVCDNNSTDRTAEIARAAGARVVFEPVNQISRARNAGAQAATGDWLVFVDADSRPPPALFADVFREIEKGRTLAGGATVAFEHAALAPRLVLGLWNLVSRMMRWAAGSFMFCDAAAFRRAGGFSEELYASEELDLFRRLKRLARSEAKAIVILHRHPIVTSARKVELYTWGEMALFLLRTLLAPRRTLRSRDACYSWYDGRR
ncbi:MAG TPA: glycosyltransferase [Burkholderiales bacterium]|nr:glycosyltransferase [Burkholderiales bacterium]